MRRKGADRQTDAVATGEAILDSHVSASGDDPVLSVTGYAALVGHV